MWSTEGLAIINCDINIVRQTSVLFPAHNTASRLFPSTFQITSDTIHRESRNVSEELISSMFHVISLSPHNEIGRYHPIPMGIAVNELLQPKLYPKKKVQNQSFLISNGTC